MSRMEFNKSMTVADVPRRQNIFYRYERKNPCHTGISGSSVLH
jgi:hypothetical protein